MNRRATGGGEETVRNRGYVTTGYTTDRTRARAGRDGGVVLKVVVAVTVA